MVGWRKMNNNTYTELKILSCDNFVFGHYNLDDCSMSLAVNNGLLTSEENIVHVTSFTFCFQYLLNIVKFQTFINLLLFTICHRHLHKKIKK